MKKYGYKDSIKGILLFANKALVLATVLASPLAGMYHGSTLLFQGVPLEECIFAGLLASFLVVFLSVAAGQFVGYMISAALKNSDEENTYRLGNLLDFTPEADE